MTTQNTAQTGPAPKAATTTSADSPSLTAIAGQLGELVNEIEGLTPNLTPHDSRQARRVASAAKFAAELIAPTITTMTVVPSAPKDLFDVEAGRQALEYRDQFRPIAQRLTALGNALEFSIDSKLSKSGEDSLQTYHWAKRALLGPNGPALAPYVEEMRRAVKKAINRHPKPAPPDTPAPEAPGGGHAFMAFRRPDPEVEGELPESFYQADDDDDAMNG